MELFLKFRFQERVGLEYEIRETEVKILWQLETSFYVIYISNLLGYLFCILSYFMWPIARKFVDLSDQKPGRWTCRSYRRRPWNRNYTLSSLCRYLLKFFFLRNVAVSRCCCMKTARSYNCTVHQNSLIVVRSRTKRNVKMLNNSVRTHIYFTKKWCGEHFAALIFSLLYVSSLNKSFTKFRCVFLSLTFIQKLLKNIRFLIFFSFKTKFISREKFFHNHARDHELLRVKSFETFLLVCDFHMKTVL